MQSDRGRVFTQLQGEFVNRALNREIVLLAGIATVRPAGADIRHDRQGVDLKMLDLVGVHKIADRTEQAAGFRCANIRPHVVHETHFETEQLAVVAGCDGKFRHAVRSGRTGAERFQAIFDPLDRPTGFPRRQRHQGHIGIQDDLIAKRASDIRWRHHPQLAEGHP